VDRWPSPRALLGLADSSGDDSAGLRGTSRSSTPWGRVDQWPGPHDLRFSYEDIVLSAPSCLPSFRLASGLAAFGCLAAGEVDSSHGVVKVRPSIGISTWCPLPAVPCSEELPSGSSSKGGAVRRGVPSARGCHLPDTFRPCRSSRLRRFAPPGTLQVYCALKPIMGFAKFPASGSVSRSSAGPLSACAGSGARVRLPARESCLPAGSRSGRRLDSEEPARRCRGAWKHTGFPWPFPVASHPSELSPPQQLPRVNRSFEPSFSCSPFPGKPGQGVLVKLGPTLGTGPPQDLPSRRWSRRSRRVVLPRERGGKVRRSLGFLDLRALVRCEVRCVRPALPPAGRPMLPWACPIEGSSCRVVVVARARRLDAEASWRGAPKRAMRACGGRSPCSGPRPVLSANRLERQDPRPDQPPSRDLPAANRWKTADPTCAPSRRSAVPRGSAWSATSSGFSLWHECGDSCRSSIGPAGP
jgi:hypothetical protein